MNLEKKDRPALILIDIQKGFENIDYWGGERNNPDAEKNAGKLLALWRNDNLPVFHIKHCSTDPGSLLNENNAGNEFNDFVKPVGLEPVIKKNVNSAFIGTDLQARLSDLNITKIVIVGMTTNHCVSTTARMAGNLNFDTFIVSDATAAFCKKGLEGQVFSAKLVHDLSLATLNKEFATITTTDILIQNLFR